MPIDRQTGADQMRLRKLTQTSQGIPAGGRGSLLVFVLVTGLLYFGREVILPLAFAVLIAFALSPLLNRLRRIGLPRVPAVLSVVTVGFVAITAFLLVIGHEVALFADELPTFQYNITEKITKLREASTNTGLVRRLTSVADTVNNAVQAEAPEIAAAHSGGAASAGSAGSGKSSPVPVQIVDTSSPLAALISLMESLVSPLASSALVLVVVVFVLLEREQVRDKFVRLIGTSDLHRTTLLLEEAADRVGHYLLTQLLVNTIYAIPIALGLWVLGIPNPLLWGMVSLVFRFVPYFGPVMSSVIPLLLAIAVTPGWTVLIWTLLLFVGVELIVANVIEPYLYGSRTGLSPLAIIVAAIFWTWIWGPLGLVLSTPMTVCLVVIGRHIPQFELFNILLGDEPVLPREVRLYQRLLVGDTLEAAGKSVEETETHYLSDYHAEVTLPALMLADADRMRGVLTPAQQTTLCDSMDAMLDQLEIVVEAELEEAETGTNDAPLLIPGKRVLLVGGRSRLDDISARVLFQAIRAEGATGTHFSRQDFLGRADPSVAAADLDCVAAVFLGGFATRTSALYLRRLKRMFPSVPVGVVLWGIPEEAEQAPLSFRVAPDAPDAPGADFVAHTLPDFFAAVETEAPPRPAQPANPPRRARRPKFGQDTEESEPV